MAVAKSKLSPEDAQEMLDALGEAGSGWYRQVALAVKMEAHKALGMERRDFTAKIGIRMGGTPADRDTAIRELNAEGLSNAAIADVLRVSPHTVVDVLTGREPDKLKQAKENVAVGDGTPKENVAVGAPRADTDLRDEQILALQEELRIAADRAAEAERSRDAASSKHGDAVKALRQEKLDLARQLEQALNEPTDPKIIKRIEEEMNRANAQWLALGDANHLIALLVEAKETVTILIDKGLTDEHVRRIDPAFTELVNEYEIAKSTAVLN